MPDELLAFLWTWGRDALPLETLWTRRGRLPLARIQEETPDAVLGFLWWRERRSEARDELFRRYHLGGASDAAQDRALTLLLVVDRWDYERYPALDHLMNVRAAHRRIDADRHRAHTPRTDQREIENAAVFRPRPESSVEERDYLETTVPLELRCLHKIRENSEEQPLDLTAEELDYLARKNLGYAGDEEASGPPLRTNGCGSSNGWHIIPSRTRCKSVPVCRGFARAVCRARHVSGGCTGGPTRTIAC